MLGILNDEIQRRLKYGLLYDKILKIYFKHLRFTWSIDKVLDKRHEIIFKIQRVKFEIKVNIKKKNNYLAKLKQESDRKNKFIEVLQERLQVQVRNVKKKHKHPWKFWEWY